MAEIKYVICPDCKHEFAGFWEDGVCMDCFEARKRNKIKAEQRQKKLIMLLGQKGVDDFTFEKFNVSHENKKALEICKAFIPAKDNLYIFGNNGSGKTHLAYATARRCIEMDLKVDVQVWSDFLPVLRAKLTEEQTQKIESMGNVDCLVLDEIGLGKFTEFNVETLYRVLNRRIMNKKNGLIITSNLNLDDMATKMEDMRCADRIIELCKIVPLNAEISWRLKRRDVQLNLIKSE